MVRAIREYHERTGHRGRLQARRRHPHRQAGARLADPDEGGAGRRLAASPTCSASAPARCSTDIERQLEHFVTGRYSAGHPSPDGLRSSHDDRRRDLRDDGVRPRARERRDRALAWLEQHERQLRPLHRRRVRTPAGRDVLRRRSTRRPASRSRASPQGGAADVDAAVAAARARAAGVVRRSRGHAPRPLPLRARARTCRSTRACSPCSRRMDNGKPIRETRDIDIPLVARHFYHHAGWAQLIETRVPRLRRRSASCGQIIPWNFPLLMLAWKIAPALAAGNTVVLKPAEFTPLTALALRRDLRARPGCRRAWSTSSPATARTGAAIVEHPDIDKIAFTGSTEVGRIIREATAGTRQEAVAGARRQVARSSSSTTPTSTARSRAWSTPSGSTRARSAAPARACSCRKAIAERFIDKLRARMETLRVGDPLDKAVDIGAIVAPVQLERIRDAGASRASRKARRCGSRRGPARRRAASIRRRCSPTSRPPSTDRAGGDLRPGAGRDDASARRRRRSQLANNTRYGLAASVWTREHQPRARHRAEDQGRRGLDQLHQPVRRRRRLRRLPRERLRPRGRHAKGCASTCKPALGEGRRRRPSRSADAGREAGSRRHASRRRPAAASTAPPSCTSAASRRGPTAATAAGPRRRRQAASARSARATARTSATPSRRRARRGGWAQRDGAQPRADPLLHRREPRRARADEFADAHRRA